ncbi:vacuolar protein sorting-associated protein 41 homolog isoform X2 [Nematostella vectensis]|uniref:vacuolar protein sorting-associated protein 41 homolog isoform X2 n=1 Tax=Nematostella vectensis TaxID=45351 RepID=UPI002077539D|nr:vacuolar protein sorting-associated protein 41 homolog isoform X2 [Nematostella vectensis]
MNPHHAAREGPSKMADGKNDADSRKTDENEDDDSEGDEEEEEEEPKLKYERLGNAVNEILRKDECASCMAVHSKFLALGTHYGVVHVMDHLGNSIRSKEFPSHTTAVNQISIDEKGDYIASCSDDGRVVINGLYSSENNVQATFDSPIKSIALDPEFSTKTTKLYVTGGSKLTLTERGWFRNKTTVLHEGEGAIRTIKWRATFIAWSNDVGVRVFDTSSKKVITYIKRDQGSPRPQLYRGNLWWKDDVTLVIGWADNITICVVKTRDHEVRDLPSRYVEIVGKYKTEYYISGIASLGKEIVILSYMTDIEAGDKRQAGELSAQRPQLRLLQCLSLNESEEMSADALSIRGYQHYRCDDYHLENVAEENLFYIVSPKDIVLAKPRDMDDHLTWLIEHGKFEEAMVAVERHKKEVKKHSYQDIGRAFLKSLMDDGDYEQAARVCVKVLGEDKKLWEDEVYKFARKKQLKAIAPYIPRGNLRLSKAIYEMVLDDFLKTDSKKFQDLVKEWPADLYSVQTIIAAVQEQLEAEPENIILLETLGEMYTYLKRYDKSLAIFLKLRHPDVFNLIHQHNLFKSVQENIVMLMEFDAERAVKMLIENVDKVPVEDVVRQLSKRNELLHLYLDSLYQKDPQAGMDFHELQVGLYAEFNRSRLLPFLRSSNYYPLQKALADCEQRHLIAEMVFLHSRMGNIKQALHLIIEEEQDVDQAIEFCKEQNDEELWEDLIKYSLDKPSFITCLLHNIGTHVDPIRLIKRIPQGMKIPGLRDSLVKILQDYNLQISLREGCKKILVKDSVSLMNRLIKVQQRGACVDEDIVCQGCRGSVLASDSRRASDVIVFFCKHVYHRDCITLRGVGPFCQICTAHSQVKRMRSRLGTMYK